VWQPAVMEQEHLDHWQHHRHASKQIQWWLVAMADACMQQMQWMPNDFLLFWQQMAGWLAVRASKVLTGAGAVACSDNVFLMAAAKHAV